MHRLIRRFKKTVSRLLQATDCFADREIKQAYIAMKYI